MERRDQLFDMMNAVFTSQPWSYWQPRMRAAQVPCGEVRTVGEAVRAPETRERQVVTRVPHQVLGWVPNVRLPIRYSETPLANPRAAPAVGEHTREILLELGYDDEQVRRLRGSGALG
jgi:crotonobetainyl-CoA:carnitine CoA-transferase CaiB-like acyl-CoA transferase